MPNSKKPMVSVNDRDAKRFNLVIQCNLAVVRDRGVVSVDYNIDTGAIYIHDEDDTPTLEKMIERNVCLSKNLDSSVCIGVRITGILRRRVAGSGFKIV
jgi:hypothetical protein